MEVGLHLCGVVAQEVHGLAHLGHAVGAGLACFAHQQAQQLGHLRFEQVGGAQQGVGTLCRGGGCPGSGRLAGPGQGLIHLGQRGFLHLADHILVVCRVAHRLGGAGGGVLGQQRPGVPWLQRALAQGDGQVGQHLLVGQIQPLRVVALRAIQAHW